MKTFKGAIFRDRAVPEHWIVAGYAALIEGQKLEVPLPDELCVIGKTQRRYVIDKWRVFRPSHAPDQSFKGHLTFALKWEGLDLYVLKALFQSVGQQPIEEWVRNEPASAYSRRAWAIYEWLLGAQLDLPNTTTGTYTDLLNPALQFSGPSTTSTRHRIRINLPGTPAFCPLIRRTPRLEEAATRPLAEEVERVTGRVHRDVLHRAAAFLLLHDSKASYAIEGEHPPADRAQRWAAAIGQAGTRTLTTDELLHLQTLVLGNARYQTLGFRTEGGFVGEHDRDTGAPIPDHISARPEDLPSLMNGLLETARRTEGSDFPAVLAAAMLAFGFVFIHPFEDGNGRIHRYLIHHALIRGRLAPKGIVFPVSAAILGRIGDYRAVLEAYSLPRLPLHEWRATPANNVEVLNDTADLYRYFDATRQAEFLYDCIAETVEHTLPDEVAYLQKYDALKTALNARFDLPDRTLSLIISFLQQGNGAFSHRAREKEFTSFEEAELAMMEALYTDVFG